MACLEMLELAAISGATETFLTAFPCRHPLTGDSCCIHVAVLAWLGLCMVLRGGRTPVCLASVPSLAVRLPQMLGVDHPQVIDVLHVTSRQLCVCPPFLMSPKVLFARAATVSCDSDSVGGRQGLQNVSFRLRRSVRFTADPMGPHRPVSALGAGCSKPLHNSGQPAAGLLTCHEHGAPVQPLATWQLPLEVGLDPRS